MAKGSLEAFLDGGRRATPCLPNLPGQEEMAAREAIRLDPKYAGGYAALASVEIRTAGKIPDAEDHYRQALALDPNDPEVLDSYSQALAAVGRIRDALRLRGQLRTLEPFVPVYTT